jgi:hypothetical protein
MFCVSGSACDVLPVLSFWSCSKPEVGKVTLKVTAMKCEAMNLFKKINCDEALIGDFH